MVMKEQSENNNREAEARRSFCMEKDLDFFRLSLYHGTDRFVVDMDERKREKYRKALRSFLNVCCRLDIDIYSSSLDANEGEHEALAVLGRIRDGSNNFMYENLYTTSSLYAASRYSEGSFYMGEIGRISFHLYSYTKRKGIDIDISAETMDIITDLFEGVKTIEKSPVILRINPIGIESTEDGRPFDDNEIVALKLTGLSMDRNISYRMNKDITLDEFEVIDFEQEKAVYEENKKRLKLAFEEYKRIH